MSTKRISAVILAAGSGSRMKSAVPKQYLNILGESVIHRSVRAFYECDLIDSLTVVTRVDETESVRTLLSDLDSKPITVIEGGATRNESAFIGVSATDAEVVAIHDAARCLVTDEIITAVVNEALRVGAASAGTFSTDTVKETENKLIVKTLDRTKLFMAHTPQVFDRSEYLSALDELDYDGIITDDNMIFELTGRRVAAVETGKNNIKITTAEDLLYAEFLLSHSKKETVNDIE